MSDWVRHYQAKGINLIPLPMPHTPTIQAAWAGSVSYHTYVWLKDHQHNFDIIHFPECLGSGFYSLLAKRQGIAFAQTTFVVWNYGPILWVKRAIRITYESGELEMTTWNAPVSPPLTSWRVQASISSNG